jgi:hypothetical protein
MPGQRDRHAGCVGAYLVEHDLFDFMLFSLPDNDTWSHKYGPDAQVRSIAEADRALERIMHVHGGIESFLDDHAVIVMSDHSQTSVEHRVNLEEALGGWRVLQPSDVAPAEAELAVCPAARSAMLYVLGEDDREENVARAAGDLEQAEGVDLIARRLNGDAIVWSERGELRFRAGGELEDQRGGRWTVEGEHAALDLSVQGSRVTSETYPDALGRLWSALQCSRAGDVLVSAELGYEFVDWGGADHVGGGSHGSLHRGDSLGVLLTCGVDMPERAQWSIADASPLVLRHFSLSS